MIVQTFLCQQSRMIPSYNYSAVLQHHDNIGAAHISSVHNDFELWRLDFLYFRISSLCM